MGSAPAPVILVAPPFRPLVWPALGLSLLKANLRAHGFAAEVLYLNLQFADRIGAFVFERVGGQAGLALGEFLFSCVRFAKDRGDIERFVEEVVLPSPHGPELAVLLSPRRMVAGLESLVHEASDFCAEAVTQIASRRPWLAGFSSLHQEHLASLAIANQLKELDPSILTIIGGANTEGVMGEELFARFPEFDFVAQGECDRSLVELARELQEQRPPAPIPGILRRDLETEIRPSECLSSEQLEVSPLPDFDDYFTQWKQMRRPEAIVPGLAIEVSRGCWWGARKACTFCGFSNDTWAFRNKSAKRALREVNELVERFGIHDVWVVDLILDHRLFRDFFPTLAERPLTRFFWETTGALSKKQTRLLARAQVRRIQAGIESLSDHSLRLMHKPTSQLRNLQTLKWCREVGIQVAWNFLCGMPGESEEDLAEIEALVRAIPHLEPPSEAHLVRVQRFSPYFEQARESGFGETRPAAFYGHLYPLPEPSLERLALHFETAYTGQYAATPRYGRLGRIMRDWRDHHHRSRLEVISGTHTDWLLDTRPGRRRRLRRLTGAERDVLAACDSAVTQAELTAALPTGSADGVVRNALATLIRDQVVLVLDGHFLSVAMRPERWPLPNWPAAARIRRMRIVDAIVAMCRLRISPFGLFRFALLRLPRTLQFAGQRLSALAWRALATAARRLLGDRLEPREGCQEGGARAVE